MGKIILSERQYSKLKKSLVSHSITESIGKQSNLRLINEDTEIENIGRNVNNLLKTCNGVWSTSNGRDCLSKMSTYLSKLNTREKLDEAAKYMSYWYVNNWPLTLGWFINSMLTNSGISEDQALQAAKTFQSYFQKAGGVLNYSTMSKEIDGEYKTALKPKSFTLTWKSTTPASTSTGTATTSGTAATPTTSDSGDYKSPIVCKDFNIYWPVFKKQVDFFLWGCKEQHSPNYTQPNAKVYRCPAGINFFGFETTNDPDWAYSNQTKNGWQTNACYAGEPFRNVNGTDDSGNKMTLAQFISQNTPQQATTKTQPATQTQQATQTQKATQKPQVQPKSYTTGGGGGAPDIPV